MALENQAGLIKIINAVECMEKSLSCAICLEISSEPVETRCGHLFCRNCIKKVLGHPGESCPVCKSDLTRRNISSSNHMGLCIQQLSKLVDAIRSDTDIDITSCLKTHYKKRAFLPSFSSSFPQSQQELENQIPPLESDDNTPNNPQNKDNELSSKKYSVEYRFHKPREQTNNNLYCKMNTAKLEANPLQFTAKNASPVQNENLLPLENTSGVSNKTKFTSESHQFAPKVNDKFDTSFEENRQCLKDISTLNLNRSLTDQSTKTWSRVAKFGKELRRKSGRNSQKIHKKPKLCVNVRDKSNLTNASLDNLTNASLDNLTDREKSGDDRVDHDTDTNNSMVNRHEDDLNVPVSEINKNIGEKVKPARFNEGDEIISKNKEQKTLRIINSNICNEHIASEGVNETDERLSDSGLGKSTSQRNKSVKKIDKEKKKLADVSSTSDPAKTVLSVNNAGKQSSEDKEKLADDSSAADSAKSLFSANKTSKQSSEDKGKLSDATLKTNTEKSVISENKTSKQLYEKKGIHSEASLNTDFGKLVGTANKGSKISSDEKEQVPESSNASTEKETETVRTDREKKNQVSNVESHKPRTKRTQYANVAENVVRFKKLGHLFKAQKKSVAFLYLGSLKSGVSEIYSGSESGSICKLCSSCQLSDKSYLLQKQCLGSTGRLNRAKSFESANFNSRMLHPLPEISTSRINRGATIENPFQIPSAPKELIISPKIVASQSALTVNAKNTSPSQRESVESSIIRRKRKRSESSDHEDGCTEKQSGKRVSKRVTESPERTYQCTENQSENRVSNKVSEFPDQEDQFTKKQSDKRMSKDQSETPDRMDQCTENQSGRQSKSPDPEDQCTTKQSDKRMSTKQSEAPDHEDPCTKKQSGKRSKPPDPEDQCTTKQSGKRSKSLDPGDQCTTKQSGKRSEFPDREDQCTKEQSEKRASHELPRTENDKSFPLDSLFNKTLHSIGSQSLQAGELSAHDMDTTDVNNPPEQENVAVDPVDIDFTIKNAFQEANVTLRRNLTRTFPKPSPVPIPDVPKNVNCTKSRDLIGLETRRPSKTYLDGIGQNSDFYEYEEGSENNFSRASMMDITGEELLLKKFEEHLFGTKKSDLNNEKRSENDKESKENTTDAVVVAKRTLITEPLDQRVSLPTTALVEHNQSFEIEDFMELTPTQQNSNRLNDPPEINQNKESTDIQPNLEIPQNCEQTKSSKTPLRSTIRENKDTKTLTPAQSTTKMCPLYQSTPKSSQVPKDGYLVNVNEHKISEIPRLVKLNPPITRRCILCSGLSSKQSEDVRYLSKLFNMQYTKKFTDDVTHIIVKTNDENNGACKTLKYLQGVAYRKWVLSFNWIVDCVAQRKLLNEETYEVVDSTTLIAGPKKARSGEKGPFDGFVFYCVEPFQNISVPDYEDLLRKMGATVVGSLNELAAEKSIFKIIAVQAECHEKKIIEWHQITKAVPVAQEWIVECISQYRLVSLLPFLQELVPQDILDLGFPEELIQDDDSDFMYDMST